jgi:hypothetical protein
MVRQCYLFLVRGPGASSCQVVDGPALKGGLSRATFSDSSDSFQTGIIAVICTADRSALGHGPSACAQNWCFFAHNGWNLMGAINRRVARVRELSWLFLAHIELICDPPTHSLTLFA